MTDDTICACGRGWIKLNADETACHACRIAERIAAVRMLERSDTGAMWVERVDWLTDTPRRAIDFVLAHGARKLGYPEPSGFLRTGMTISNWARVLTANDLLDADGDPLSRTHQDTIGRLYWKLDTEACWVPELAEFIDEEPDHPLHPSAHAA